MRYMAQKKKFIEKDLAMCIRLANDQVKEVSYVTNGAKETCVIEIGKQHERIAVPLKNDNYMSIMYAVVKKIKDL